MGDFKCQKQGSRYISFWKNVSSSLSASVTRYGYSKLFRLSNAILSEWDGMLEEITITLNIRQTILNPLFLEVNEHLH